MSKKVDVLFICTVVFFTTFTSIAFGSLVLQELFGEKKTFLSKGALFLAEVPINFQRILLGFDEDLVTLEQRFEGKSGFVGNPNTGEKYLLLARYDGDLEESVVELIDLTNFDVLHTWNPDIDLINGHIDTNKPEFKFVMRDAANIRYELRHPWLTDDGGLIFKNHSPLVKINHCSNLVWQNQEDRFHHSIEQDHEGNLWVPSYIFPFSLPEEKVGNVVESYLENGIAKLSLDGEILYHKSLSEVFIENKLEYLLFSIGVEGFNSDPIHINDIEPVLEDGPYWKKGDLFLSLRHQSMIILYRPASNEIVWKSVGNTHQQHDIDILDSTRISIFNNNSKYFYTGNVVDGNNEILIYDFETQEFTPYLAASMKEHDVRTVTEGRSEILGNGDLFLEEQDYGRILYFTSNGELQWEYVNRASDNRNYFVSWSRILHTADDLKKVEKLRSLEKCS